MQVSSIISQNTTYTAQTKETYYNDYRDNWDDKAVDIFNELSSSWTDQEKLQRGLVLDMSMNHPLFLSMQEPYPDKMPSDVKRSLESAKSSYEKQTSVEDKRAFSLEWSLSHRGKSTDAVYDKFLETFVSKYVEKPKNEEKIDYELEAFVDDLTTKGAAKFLHDFNQDKIDKLVDEYREKLEKDLEQNPNSGIDIEEMTANFKKDLLEKFKELNEDSKNAIKSVKSLQDNFMNQVSKNDSKLSEVLSLF